MGNVCCHRRADNDEWEPLATGRLPARHTEAIRWWSSVTGRLQRLAFKRRQWAYLGHLLRQIKQAGAIRSVDTDQ